MKDVSYKILLAVVLVMFFFPLAFGYAQNGNPGAEEEKPPNLNDIKNSLEKTGGEGGLGVDTEAVGEEGAVYKTIGTAVSIIINIVGIISVFVIFYGGWLWVTAQGNEEQIGKAKKVIRDALIALVIVLTAWVIYATLYYMLAFV